MSLGMSHATGPNDTQAPLKSVVWTAHSLGDCLESSSPEEAGHTAFPPATSRHTTHLCVSVWVSYHPGNVGVAGQTAVTVHPWALKSCPPKSQWHRGSPIFHGFSYSALEGSWKMGWKTLEKPVHLRTGAAWLLEGSRACKTPGPATKVQAALAVRSQSHVPAQLAKQQRPDRRPHKTRGSVCGPARPNSCPKLACRDTIVSSNGLRFGFKTDWKRPKELPSTLGRSVGF